MISRVVSKLSFAVMRHAASQASRQLLEEEFPVESIVLDELQTQTVERASSHPRICALRI